MISSDGKSVEQYPYVSYPREIEKILSNPNYSLNQFQDQMASGQHMNSGFDPLKMLGKRDQPREDESDRESQSKQEYWNEHFEFGLKRRRDE